MVVCNSLFLQISKTVLIFLTVQMSHAVNLGLIAGDLKPLTNPISIKKYNRHSPIFININSKSNPLPSLPLPKLPSKPPFKFPKPSLLSSSKLQVPIIPPIIVPPVIPKLPLLPLLPILPPILPPLPLVPPVLPRIPPLIPSIKLKKLLKPLKFPILGKTRLQKALGSEINTVTVPCPSLERKDDKISKNIVDKLTELKNRGTITGAEFRRILKCII
ncbi:RNA-binding protein 12 [Galleria mellonella]|uniref:RNA-binding protein 12 n=1 Tax=Galleria mellonella TaxID=7137 RepID=A0A6J3C030_GALME|nr:RNA-binding protein 12 [Galleria mellonella]